MGSKRFDCVGWRSVASRGGSWSHGWPPLTLQSLPRIPTAAVDALLVVPQEEIYAGLAADLPESPQAWALRARHAAPSGDARDAIAAGLEVFERGLAAAPSPGLYSEAVEFLVQALEGDAPGADETLATACELCRRVRRAVAFGVWFGFLRVHARLASPQIH